MTAVPARMTSPVRAFEARCDAVVTALDETLATPPAARAPASGGPIVITGTGASEGPARIVASALQQAGRFATFAPLSAFYGLEEPAPEAHLVVFSQGLSPNAQMVLDHGARAASVTLFTSVDERGEGSRAERLRAIAEDGGTIIHHPPASESGLLVRLVGPSAATLAGLLWAGVPSQALRPAVECVRRIAKEGSGVSSQGGARVRAPAVGVGDEEVVVMVARGRYLEAASAFRTKWLETLGGPAPATWDVMAFVHGPLQHLWERRAVVVGFERSMPSEKALFDRLEAVLAKGRHRLVRIRSEHAGWGAFFEHDAALNRLLSHRLLHAPRDTRAWPGSGIDAALYDLDACVGGRCCAPTE